MRKPKLTKRQLLSQEYYAKISKEICFVLQSLKALQGRVDGRIDSPETRLAGNDDADCYMGAIYSMSTLTAMLSNQTALDNHWILLDEQEAGLGEK